MEFAKRNRKHVLHVTIELSIETRVEVWKNLKTLDSCPTAFLILQNFYPFVHVFYYLDKIQFKVSKMGLLKTRILHGIFITSGTFLDLI